MPKRSSKSTGPTSPAMRTCGRSRQKASGASMSSAEDSPAKTLARQARRMDCVANAADCGTSTPELLAAYDPATSSWRTSQRSLLEEWTPFSGRFPRSGMTRSGTAFLLPTLAPRLDAKVEIGCGLWPTPTAGDSLGRGYHGRLSGNWWPSLAGAVSLAEGDPVQCVTAGRVNPQFVEWIMGFPLGWTALDASETPWSRRSSRSSDGQSSNESES
jgi:hypothetical protein